MPSEQVALDSDLEAPISEQAEPDERADDLDAPIRDADKMAEVVGLTTTQFYYHVGKGRFDVSRLGSRLISTKRRLLRSVGIHPPA